MAKVNKKLNVGKNFAIFGGINNYGVPYAGCSVRNKSKSVTSSKNPFSTNTYYKDRNFDIKVNSNTGLRRFNYKRGKK